MAAMYTSVAISVTVFGLVALRHLLPARVRIWHIMGAGAVAVLALGELSPREAFAAVDWDVLLYLFGVFAVAASLHVNGFSERLIEAVAGRIDLERWGLLGLMLFTAVTAAVLTNDAAAVIGTPLALVLARSLQRPATIPLLALCCAATLGSLLTPVGNPQNVLIAAKGNLGDPIATFFGWLAAPALASLLFAYLWFARCLRRSPRRVPDGRLKLPDHPETGVLPALASTLLLALLVVADSLHQGATGRVLLPLGAIGLLAAAPALLFDRHRLKALRALDWPTLAFFVAMFVVTSAVLKSGLLQDWLVPVQDRLESPPLVYLLGFGASQLFSNVPTVEIYLNLLQDPGVEASMLLAASSTLAGNLFILGAASNVIVVQQTEALGVRAFGFWQFCALCLPVTLVSLLVSYLWLVFLI